MALSEKEVGIVLIGRNEGDRLKNCVRSLPLENSQVVYVDSGSTDDSVEFCQSMGVEVVALDMSMPFTAARARNAGFQRLLQVLPSVEFVQFIDGDCQLVSSWLAVALDFLQQNPRVAAVCGRRKEVHPEASIYNQLCDIEWDTPIGEARACGGDVLMRAQVLHEAGGYRENLIAGEEPELCFRMRQLGWKVYRLDAAMTLHDADMSRFSQWWKRSRRAGYAYMNGALLHGKSTEHYNVKPVLRGFFWAAVLPISIALLCLGLGLSWLFLFLIYPAQWLKMTLTGKHSLGINLKWAYFNVVGKFAEFSGMLQCLMDTIGSRNATLIEYK